MPLLDLLRPVSDEELRLLSERNPGWQFERLADGRLAVSPTGGESGRISAAVLGQLYRWNEARGLGVVFDASTGFKLPDGAVLSPDAAFLRGERWRALSPEEREGFPPLAPEAVFEVRSRSQSLEELREKGAWYLKNGVRLVVLLDLTPTGWRSSARGGWSATGGRNGCLWTPSFPASSWKPGAFSSLDGGAWEPEHRAMRLPS